MGGGTGATFHREIFGNKSGKTRQGKRGKKNGKWRRKWGKIEKGRRKMWKNGDKWKRKEENEKCKGQMTEKSWYFFCCCCCFSLLGNTETFSGATKMEILTEKMPKSCWKKIGKSDSPPKKKISCYAPEWVLLVPLMIFLLRPWMSATYGRPYILRRFVLDCHCYHYLKIITPVCKMH